MTNLLESLRLIQNKTRYFFIKNKNISIISNNCLGADISSKCSLPFNSPTVNLQIVPDDFLKFCKNIDYYLNEPLIELTQPTKSQEIKILRLFGKPSNELGFPLGSVDDVLIVFQHYQSFQDAYDCWERRKVRSFAENRKFIFLVEKEYEKEANDFLSSNLPNSHLFTWGWECPSPAAIFVPKVGEVHFMSYKSAFKAYYEHNFNIVSFKKYIRV